MEMVLIRILNMSISASWLVLAVLILRKLLKYAPKWIHVALWSLVAVRLLCPVSMESMLSLIPSAQTVPESIVYAHTPEIDSGVAVIDQAVNSSVMQELTPQVMASVNPVQVYLFIGSVLWIAGMILLFLWALISYMRLKLRVRASVQMRERVFVCDYIDTPFILGLLRPLIYIPSSLDREAVTYVLAHEHAHIQRRDHWWKPLGYTLLTLHWFNPLLWLAYILLCRDIEMACDEKVIRSMELPEKKAYSQVLLNCSVNRRQIAACPLAFGEVGVKERIRSVLNYRKPGFWMVLIGLAALVITGVCFLTDPVKSYDTAAADFLEDYTYERVRGRMDREEVSCISAREGYGLVWCRGEGPELILYQYEKDGDSVSVVNSFTGEYAISGGMSLNHLENGGKHIYFGTISQYHYNPIVDTKTWINWDYLSVTDGNGRTTKQDMTGRDGYLFVLDAPMADFQAVDGLGTVCLNLSKYQEQGYLVKEHLNISATGGCDPFGYFYRILEPRQLGHVPVSYLGLDTQKLYRLTRDKGLASYDSMDGTGAYSVAKFKEVMLTEDHFSVLFQDAPEVGKELLENHFRAWEYHRDAGDYDNFHDFFYLLQQKDGSLLLALGQIWEAQYREGESLIYALYPMQRIETDDPFAQADSPYQWTWNLRKFHVRQVYMLSRDPRNEDVTISLSQREFERLMQILNSLTEGQIVQGKLKNEILTTAVFACQGVNVPPEECYVQLEYDGVAVRMVFTVEAAKCYPLAEDREWIIRSEMLNQFLSVYTWKAPEEDPFSDPDNGLRWCRNITPNYLENVYVSVGEGTGSYLVHLESLQQQELLRILNALPDTAFEKAQLPEKAEVQILFNCRNVTDQDQHGIGVSLMQLEDDFYWTCGSEWEEYHQTWKIKSHALKAFLREFLEKVPVDWRDYGAIGLLNEINGMAVFNLNGVEVSVPKLPSFTFREDPDGIRFKPEDQEGWVLIQYRTEPFASCGTGLVTQDASYKNGKYAATYGFYDGSPVWSFVSVTTTSGDMAFQVVLLNEEVAPWVTEYHYEITELISEMAIRVTG